MNILITGGTGFIGQILNQYLQQHGHHTWVLTRDKVKAQKSLPVATHIIESLTQIPQTQGVDGVINLAGEPLMGKRWNRQNKQLFIDSRVNMTNDIIHFIQQRKVKPEVLINGSAIGFYGSEQTGVLEETSGSGDDFAASLCEQWEAAANKAVNLGVRVCSLRIAITLGADGGPYKEMVAPFKLGLGATFGSGQQWMSWVHVGDLVNLIDFLLTHKGTSGVFNGTSPQPATNADFSQQLGAALKRPVWFKIPAAVLTILLGEAANLLLTGQKVIPKQALDAGFTFAYPDLSSAFKQLTHKGGKA